MRVPRSWWLPALVWFPLILGMVALAELLGWSDEAISLPVMAVIGLSSGWHVYLRAKEREACEGKREGGPHGADSR